jgi:hypothetical protein
MKGRDIMGVEVYIHSFLTLVLNGVEWLTSQPYQFTLRNEPQDDLE